MADIMHGEQSKKVLRMVLKTGMKFMGLSPKIIESDLMSTQNPVIKNLNTLVLATSNAIKSKWQSDVVKTFGQAFLWIAYKDTAYREPFFWMLQQLLDVADDFSKINKPYVAPPDEWQPNLWIASREKSKNMKDKGEIPIDAKCMEETMFTPSIQRERLKKILNKK